MERARIQAIAVGLGMTAMIVVPLFMSVQPPLEGPGGHVAAPVAEPPAVGRPAPPVHLVDFKGQAWKLADLRDKQAALLVFWASWCESCRGEAPHVEQLRKDMQGQPLVIAGINVQDERGKAQAMVDELKLGYTILDDYQLVAAQDYQVRALPTVVLIDAGGTIRFQGHELPPADQIAAALPVKPGLKN